MLVGDHFFFLEVGEEECALRDEDPSFYAHSIHGNVVGTDEDENKVLVGRFHLYYLDICAAVNARASVFDMFDCRAATLDYYGAIFGSGSLCFTDELEKLFRYEPLWGNILILERLEILPAYRGHNLGLIVIRRLIERFGAGAAVVGMKPFPLQLEFDPYDKDEVEWRTQLKLSDLDKNARRATAKLRRHYAKLGFKLLTKTPFMFRLGDAPLPSPEDLLR